MGHDSFDTTEEKKLKLTLNDFIAKEIDQQHFYCIILLVIF